MTRKEWFLAIAIFSLFIFAYSGISITRVVDNISTVPVTTLPVDYSKSPTVLLFGSSKCPSCVKSAEFYKKLGLKPVQIVAVTRDPLEQMESHIKNHGYRVDKVISRGKVHVGILPTIIIVDESGNIIKRKSGVLNDSEQEEILNLLCGECK